MFRTVGADNWFAWVACMQRSRRTLVTCLGVVALTLGTSSCLFKTASTGADPENLSEQLLGVTDLESKWNETQRQVFTDRGNENPSIDASMMCPEAKATADTFANLAGDRGADVEMEMKGVTAGAILLREQAWSNENAKNFLAAVKEAVTLCDGKEWTDDMGVTNSVAVLEDPKVGDDSVSWANESSPPASVGKEKPSGVGRNMVTRIGDVVLVLQAGSYSVQNQGPLMSLEDWKVLVTRAFKKMDKVNWK